MTTEPTAMVTIPGGKFTLGDDQGNSNERPSIEVHVKSFRLDIHPVTNSQFRRFLVHHPEWRKENVSTERAESTYLALWNGLEFPDGLDEYAAINISWYAAQAYANWADKRLATEVEWEFAAGGPSHTRFSHGNDFDPSQYTFALGGDPIGFPVCQLPKNGFGLYDMCGGVWEWTVDTYAVDAYSRLDPELPLNTAPSDRRTLRGGAYTFDTPHYLRCAVRGSNSPDAAHEDYGIRCAADL